MAGTVVSVVGPTGGRTGGACTEDVEVHLLFRRERVGPFCPSWVGLGFDVHLQVSFLVVAVLPYLG